ncbi:hypothetical protein [Terrihabitans sp. B22-R8]|uniref:hypothetical protein n=1 Tax=Terrihabitans sp. B22-R8 TaxID=3425128 RepID=UPI00403CB0CF
MNAHQSDQDDELGAEQPGWYQNGLQALRTRFARKPSADPANFRTRSKNRDGATDAARMGVLRAEIRRVASEIETEHAHLKRRLDEATMRAAALMGNEDGSNFEREAEEEQDLCEAERHMKIAAGRLRQLDRQRLVLERIALLLE